MYKHDNGNVLFLILIAIILFSALSYAVTRSTQSEGKGISQEDAEIQAANANQYLNALRTAFMRLELMGDCLRSEISF